MATASDVLRIAAGEIGYVALQDPEAGSKYGRFYAKDHGSYFAGPSTSVPWCAMFVSWVFAQAGQSMPGLPTASCSVIVANNRGTSRSKSTSQAKPGDVVLFDWDPAGGNGADHAGIVESNHGSYLTTIEGNTSSGSSGSQSNGGGVWRRTRAYSTVYAIYRPVYESEDEVTEQDKNDIASKVWDMVLNDVKARDRLIGIDNAANGANNELHSTADPTGRDMRYTTHDHVKWMAANQSDFKETLAGIVDSIADIRDRVDALAALIPSGGESKAGSKKK